MEAGAFGPVRQPGALLLHPGREQGVIAGRQGLAQGGDAGRQLALLVGAQDGLLRRSRSRVIAAVAIQAGVAQRVEVSEDLVVILLTDRVELMVVALRAGQRQTQHRLAQRFHAVRVVVQQVLGGDRATLVGVHVIPLEARGDQLGVRRVREEVAGKLLEQEAVVGLVVVESLDHPVAPEPELTTAVDREPVGVGVAGGIQPIERHAFAEVRRGQQAVHLLLVGSGGAVLQEGLQFLRRRRQTSQVER